jgi:very-short-patch-repair endonuclease
MYYQHGKGRGLHGREQGSRDVMVLSMFDRHQRLRERGQPWTTIVATEDGGTRLWNAWCTARGRAMARTTAPDERQLVEDFLAASARQTLVDKVLVKLAERLGLGPQAVPSLAAAGSAERERLCREARVALPLGIADLACSVLGQNRALGLAALAAAVDLLGADAPALIFEANRESLPALAAMAARVATAAATVPVALTAPAAVVQAHLAAAAETRSKALMRQGWLQMPLSAATGEPRAPQLLAPDSVKHAHARAMELCAQARMEDRPALEQARSAAEWALYVWLEDHHETRGRFALNETLPVRFGPRPIEIDLLCNELGIAVEVDGFYHFRELDAYRRDRRKDVVMQREGLLVVRVLAEDVINDLDATGAGIIEVVRFCRHQMGAKT